MRILPLLALILITASVVRADESALPPSLRDVGFDQHLDEQVPLDLVFKDETGRDVLLGDYFNHGKPVILVLAWYRCPMLCTEVLNGLVRAMRDMSLNLGKDFEVVTVSFDARETPELAAAKKKTYLERYGRPGAEAAWHFLTGAAGTDRPADAGRRFSLPLRRRQRPVRPRQRHHGADAGWQDRALLLRHSLFAARSAPGACRSIREPHRLAGGSDPPFLFPL